MTKDTRHGFLFQDSFQKSDWEFEYHVSDIEYEGRGSNKQILYVGLQELYPVNVLTMISVCSKVSVTIGGNMGRSSVKYKVIPF